MFLIFFQFMVIERNGFSGWIECRDTDVGI